MGGEFLAWSKKNCMIRVDVYKQSNYPVSLKKIKQTVRETVQKSGIVSDSFVDVALVSRQKVSELANRYLEETGVEAGDHAVLSFPDSEVERPFVASPDSNLYLGEIVINYPKAVELAGKSGKF